MPTEYALKLAARVVGTWWNRWDYHGAINQIAMAIDTGREQVDTESKQEQFPLDHK